MKCAWVTAIMALSILVLGCNVSDVTPQFMYARNTTADASTWQAYISGRWQDVMLRGVQTPAVLRPHVVRAGNMFIFLASVDSSLAGPARLLLRAWTVSQPVFRVIDESVPVDSTSRQSLTRDDFRTVMNYERYTVTIAGEFWPPERLIEGHRRKVHLTDRVRFAGMKKARSSG
jgi:hypothetical protein